MTAFSCLRHRLCICIALCLLLSATDALAASSPVALGRVMPPLRLTPHMDALEDRHGTLRIEEVASSDYIHAFTPLAFRPVNASAGATWLRLTLESDASGNLERTMRFPVLNLGAAQPGPVRLYAPRYASTTAVWPDGWDVLEANGKASFPLPMPEGGTLTCYIRLAGPPGLWFYPELTLRAATSPVFSPFDFGMALAGALGALAVLNLLFATLQRNESRGWLALYSALALIYWLTAPSPAPAGGLPFSAAWAILTPGLAMVLLPHMGRHILQSWKHSPVTDRVLRILSGLGAILAVAPLVPTWGWLVRALPLWPCLAILPAVAAADCARKTVPGARRFVLACTLTTMGAFASLAPAQSADMAVLFALLPFAGTVLGVLILTLPASRPAQRAPLQATDASSHAMPEESASPESSPHAATGMKARQSDDFSAGQAVLTRLSHDLRTPLNAIVYAAEQITPLPQDEQGLIHLRTLQAAAGNLSTLINDLLDVSRAQKGRILLRQRPFDLQRLLMEAHDIIQPQAERKGLSLHWVMAPHLNVKYGGDADRLLQILLNLLGNAIRFSDTGTVRLTVDRVPESTDPGYLLFRVTDNGISIPLQNQYDVFEQFCQSPGTGKGRFGGSGLGLTIVRELVGLMGGVVCLASRPTVGTEVSFTVRLLPLDNATTTADPFSREDTRETTFSAPQRSSQASHVLVADDVASNRQLVRFFLEGLPYTVTETRSGEEAVARYMDSLPGMALVDADMPGSGGPHAVRSIRAYEEEQGITAIPVVALVSKPEEAAAMLHAGSTATLMKPLSRMRLIEMVTRLAPPAMRAFHIAPKSSSSLPSAAADVHDVPKPGVPDAKQIASPALPDTPPAPNAPHGHTAQSKPDVALPPARANTKDEEVSPVMPKLATPAPTSVAPRTDRTPASPQLDMSLIPLVPGLVANMDEAMRDAQHGVRDNSPLGVQEAVGRLAGTAASFGLRDLERMSRCVERAAEADDLEAILTLLPELETMVRRNQRALSDIHRMHASMVKNAASVR